MREAINEEVSVVLYYSAKKREALPWLISWQNKDYAVGKIRYHHKVKTGDTLHHVFELVDKEKAQWFRLNLDTANLHWIMEAVHDGLAH